jgi:hypothetical protein
MSIPVLITFIVPLPYKDSCATEALLLDGITFVVKTKKIIPYS